MRGPLDGVTVLDLSQALSGPFATQLMAFLGARVIKVEKPGGDDSRGMPPHEVAGTSAYFLSVNRGKESVVVDLKQPDGVDIVLRLAERCNIVIENNRPGVLDKLGLGFDALCRRNPRLVYCPISGFGQDGPFRDHPAYDLVVQAMSGGMSLTGEPGRKPVRAGVAVADLCAGYAAVIAALSALRAAELTGDPQLADVSMLDVQVAMLCYQLVYYMISDVVPGPLGSGHTSLPEVGAFECGDGVDIVLAPMSEQMWPGLCDAIERPDLRANAELGTRALRLERRVEVRAELANTLAQHSSQHWLTRLQAHGIPAAPINTLDRVVEHPQVRARGMLVDVDFQGEPVKLIGSPIKVTGMTDAPAPPAYGEHTARILIDELGITLERVRDLAARGVIDGPIPSPTPPGVT